MAEIALAPVWTSQEGEGVKVWKWETLQNGDTGAPLKLPAWQDKTVHVLGTFGAGGNVILEGTNEATPANYAPLNNPQGTAQNTITAAKLVAILENPMWIRPRVSAGDGTTDIDVVVVAKKSS